MLPLAPIDGDGSDVMLVMIRDCVGFVRLSSGIGVGTSWGYCEFGSVRFVFSSGCLYLSVCSCFAGFLFLFSVPFVCASGSIVRVCFCALQVVFIVLILG